MKPGEWKLIQSTASKAFPICSPTCFCLLLLDLPLIFPSETQIEHEGYPSQTYPEEKTIPFYPPLYQFCEVEYTCDKKAVTWQADYFLTAEARNVLGFFFFFNL